MGIWVHIVRFIQDINSYTRGQHAGTSKVQASINTCALRRRGRWERTQFDIEWSISIGN